MRRAGRAFRQKEQNVQSVTREADKERCRCAESVEVGSGWSLHGLWPLEGLVLRKQGNWEAYYEGVEIMGFTTSGYQLPADFLPHPALILTLRLWKTAGLNILKPCMLGIAAGPGECSSEDRERESARRRSQSFPRLT